MKELKFLALDLGAESGRAVVGHLDGRALRLEEMHRFPNGPVRVNGHLHWDALRLFGEIKHGIGLAVGKALGENPWPIIVPCHRVIGSDGKLTGYVGGLWRKEWLLRHEGYLLV